MKTSVVKKNIFTDALPNIIPGTKFVIFVCLNFKLQITLRNLGEASNGSYHCYTASCEVVRHKFDLIKHNYTGPCATTITKAKYPIIIYLLECPWLYLYHYRISFL